MTDSKRGNLGKISEDYIGTVHIETPKLIINALFLFFLSFPVDTSAVFDVSILRLDKLPH